MEKKGSRGRQTQQEEAARSVALEMCTYFCGGNGVVYSCCAVLEKNCTGPFTFPLEVLFRYKGALDCN